MMALRTITSEDTALFWDEKGLAGSVLWASVVNSLVPFLGIVFVPVALAICLYRILRKRDNVILYFIASIVILFAQIGLWSLLYRVSTLNQ